MLGIHRDLLGGRISRNPKSRHSFLIIALMFTVGVLPAMTMAADVYTDKTEYLPGETAIIDGVTFWSQEMVTLQVTQLDGTPLPGDGGLPWDVSADNVGDFETTWTVEWEYAGDTLQLIATGQESGEMATTTFVAPGTNLDQLQNGTITTSPQWANGDINSSNSCYSEGSSVPYRYFISGLDGGTSHYFTIQMEWTKATIHALDYLTDYDATEDSAITLAGGPCGAPSPPSDCSTPTESFPFPDFLNTSNYTGTIPPDFFTTVNPGFVLDGPRNLKAYNVTIDSIGPYLFGGSSSDRTLEFIVYFTVEDTGSAGFFWGGHLAEGSADAWGYGSGASSVSGAPYHMRAKALDGSGGAGQDRSIQSAVICLPPSVGIVCGIDSVCNINGTTYICRDTASSANYWTWTVINGTIVGPDYLDSVVFTVNPGLQPGIDSVYILVESCDSTSGCPGDFCCAYDSVAIPVGDCNDPPEVICAEDTSIFLCDSAEICIHGFSYSDPNNNIASVTVTPGTIEGDSVCFAPAEGLNTIILTVTDDLGETAVCTTLVTVTFNDPPVATCPGDMSMFVCDLSPITLDGFGCSDPDNNLATCTVNNGTLSGSQVTFTPVAGANTIILTATDDCEEIAACTTIVTVDVNVAPVCNLPDDGSYFVCGDTTFSFPVSATDADGNLVGCTKTSGPGTLSGGYWTFTTTGPGVYSATFSCNDECGLTCGGTVNITVTYNQAPVATCPGDQSLFVCDLSPITLDGFACSDADGNLATCSVDNGTLTGSQVTFTPVVGVNTITLTATDSCGATDQCTVNVTVAENTAPICNLPDDGSYFVCGDTTFSFPVSATDADDNLVGCTKTSGPGTLSGGYWTFTTTGPGVYSATFSCADECDETCGGTVNITVTYNQAPVASCPGDTSINFLCEPSEICRTGFTASDADNNIATETASFGMLNSGTVCFTPDTAGVYEIIYTVTDDCGEVDACTSYVTVSYTNQPPVASCHGDTAMFVCNLSPITLGGYSCSDPDGNLSTCIASGGTLSGDQVTFTPIEGDNTIILTATDDCGLVDACTTIVTVTLNRPPVATCPGDQSLFVCDLSDITLTGFGCSDPDNNLTSCTVNNGSLSGSDVTFSPVPGLNTIILTATDECGETASCTTDVTIILNQMPYLDLPNDTSIFFCTVEELCFQFDMGDPDYPQYQSMPTAYLLSGPGTLKGDTICFTPVDGVDSTYWIKIQVCDSCGTPSTPSPPVVPPNSCVVDSFSVTVSFNSPPVVECPGDTAVEWCELKEICIDGFTASDPDDNLASVSVSMGTLTGSTVCFTPTGEGTYNIVFTAEDECFVTAECTTTVTVTLIDPPVAECPPGFDTTMCDFEEICIDGFSCSGGYTTCEVIGYTLTDGTVCFTPTAEGTYDFILVAAGECGADTCTTTVAVNLYGPPTIEDSTYNFILCEAADVCVEPPAASGGKPPYTYTVDGRPIEDTACFMLYDDTVVTAMVIVTDDCEHADTSTMTINAIINTAPTISADAPASVFLCEPDTICVQLVIVDPDNGLIGTSEIGVLDLTDSTVCFLADTSGRYCDNVTIMDSCGLSASTSFCIDVTINSAPVCNLPDDQQIFDCYPRQVCLDASATDVDDNLIGCEVVSGPGTIVNGQWCYTFSGDASVTSTVRCTDSCGEYCEGTFTVTFDLNEGPVASCPDDIFQQMAVFEEICIPGFSCTDPDDNLVSCRVEGIGTLVGGEVCFTPTDYGLYEIYLIAEDSCGEADTCVTTVEIAPPPLECPDLVIEKTHGTLQGHYEDVSITMEGEYFTMGGFDLLIAYDASALTFVEATPGQLLEDCGWEYFTYRYGADGNCGDACPSGLLRIIALAETNNGPFHPACYGPPDADPHELVTMKFYVTNDRTYECQYVPITFFWLDCNDNSISNITGDSLFLVSRIYDFEGTLIWDEDDDVLFPDEDRIPYMGVPDWCLIGDKLTPYRCVDVQFGGIDIICSDSIDARGDINVNGVPNEVADAVMFTNYFISGLDAFGSHVEASIAASDINADGIALSVADLVYLVRVVTGDASPYEKPAPTGMFAVSTRVESGKLTVSYDASQSTGAVLLVFTGDGTVGTPTLEHNAGEMELLYGRNGNQFRVLIYDIGTGKIPGGNGDLLSVPVDGSIELTEIEAADYYGGIMNVSIRSMPAAFELGQNTPNPFNPATTISMRLPKASDWSVAVYNIAGQVIKEFHGYSEAGTVNVVWDGTDSNGESLASGIYLYKVVAGDFTATRKMILMK